MNRREKETKYLLLPLSFFMQYCIYFFVAATATVLQQRKAVNYSLLLPNFRP